MKPKIYILTGEIQTGKSTKLNQWALEKHGAGLKLGGIINPLIDGEKRFVDAFNFQSFEMNARKNEKEIIEVGNFKFSSDAFAKAKSILKQAASSELDYLFIDEIGKLELNNSGLEPMVSKILKPLAKDTRTKNIVCVIRQSLLEKAAEHYLLKDYIVISKSDLDDI